ncbi:TIGR04372 family glycosyltransferase [Candidatus Thioglobus sp.]|nr:TIGR04372 family glycosyltransferase [Candidatus Thioglobus sp.]
MSNEEILNLQSKYIYEQNFIIRHVMKLLVTIMLLPSRSFDRILNIFGKSLKEENVIPLVGFEELWCSEDEIKSGFSWEIVDKYEWQNQIEEGYDLDINSHKKNIAKRILEEAGIDLSKWYVCLHVRESGFRSDRGRREYRNSSIHNYISAIKVITDAGGLVIRMGDASMTQLPELPNVIDYAFSSKKSALLDLYLIKHCRFFIGTGSGPVAIADMFFKEALFINMDHWMSFYPLRKKDRGIHKHVFSKKLGRYLTFHEVLSDDWKQQNIFGNIDSNYVLTENTPEDIDMAVSEYLHCISSDDFSLSLNQQEVNMRRVSQSKAIYKKFNISDNSDISKEVFTKYRIASKINVKTQGSICDDYLKKYLHRPFSPEK